VLQRSLRLTIVRPVIRILVAAMNWERSVAATTVTIKNVKNSHYYALLADEQNLTIILIIMTTIYFLMKCCRTVTLTSATTASRETQTDLEAPLPQSAPTTTTRGTTLERGFVRYPPLIHMSPQGERYHLSTECFGLSQAAAVHQRSLCQICANRRV
jgi:hypothetical protein